MNVENIPTEIGITSYNYYKGIAKTLTSEDHKRIDEWIEEVKSWIISGTR